MIAEPAIFEPRVPRVDALHGGAREDPSHPVGRRAPHEPHRLGPRPGRDLAELLHPGPEVVLRGSPAGAARASPGSSQRCRSSTALSRCASSRAVGPRRQRRGSARPRRSRPRGTARSTGSRRRAASRGRPGSPPGPAPPSAALADGGAEGGGGGAALRRSLPEGRARTTSAKANARGATTSAARPEASAPRRFGLICPTARPPSHPTRPAPLVDRAARAPSRPARAARSAVRSHARGRDRRPRAPHDRRCDDRARWTLLAAGGSPGLAPRSRAPRARRRSARAGARRAPGCARSRRRPPPRPIRVSPPRQRDLHEILRAVPRQHDLLVHLPRLRLGPAPRRDPGLHRAPRRRPPCAVGGLAAKSAALSPARRRRGAPARWRGATPRPTLPARARRGPAHGAHVVSAGRPRCASSSSTSLATILKAGTSAASAAASRAATSRRRIARPSRVERLGPLDARVGGPRIARRPEGGRELVRALLRDLVLDPERAAALREPRVEREQVAHVVGQVAQLGVSSGLRAQSCCWSCLSTFTPSSDWSSAASPVAAHPSMRAATEVSRARRERRARLGEHARVEREVVQHLGRASGPEQRRERRDRHPERVHHPDRDRRPPRERRAGPCRAAPGTRTARWPRRRPRARRRGRRARQAGRARRRARPGREGSGSAGLLAARLPRGRAAAAPGAATPTSASAARTSPPPRPPSPALPRGAAAQPPDSFTAG